MNETLTIEDYRERTLAAIDAKLEEDERARDQDIWSNLKRWRGNGSAGAARRWFLEVLQFHPAATPEAAAELLAQRVEAELDARPRWYTKSHLRGVVAIAKREAGVES